MPAKRRDRIRARYPLPTASAMFVKPSPFRRCASLIQLYTAMVYEGPGIAARIARGLAQRLKGKGFMNIAEAVGSG